MVLSKTKNLSRVEALIQAKCEIIYTNSFLPIKPAIYPRRKPKHLPQLLRHEWLSLRVSKNGSKRRKECGVLK
jgi:hypothetical protein